VIAGRDTTEIEFLAEHLCHIQVRVGLGDVSVQGWSLHHPAVGESWALPVD